MSMLQLTALLTLLAQGLALPTVDTAYPYTGPAIPVGDWVDNTVPGNGKGFPRLVEPPAVKPKWGATNNINVVQLAYVDGGMNVHFQTPYGIGGEPCVEYGESKQELGCLAKGTTKTYDRTPPCSAFSDPTQCSQFFHSVNIQNLKPSTKYYYRIPGGNGTTPSHVMEFTTARAPGDNSQFSVAVINDMGYTNAIGTHKYLKRDVESGCVAFAWHGGDISYADDWYSGVLPCEDDWPVCYNGTSTELPNSPPLPIPGQYLVPLPNGEFANQGGPQGGDFSPVYESNWDLWQQWMSRDIMSKIPYMVNPGNHEATCAEFDGPGNVLTAYLNNNEPNTTVANSSLTYYSCPPSQRNFTAYQHRFSMPGEVNGGRSNFWYSFDYGLAHFVSFDGETDYYQSPEYPFVADLTGNETHPMENETYITDSGPFGFINGSYKINQNYEQWQWMKKDLESVDRSKTPWVFAMSHRPMYSSEVSSYQKHMRNAWEKLFIDNGVDAYLSGHIHWYERLLPLGYNQTIMQSAVIDKNTYQTNTGNSLVHLINGQAGNIESHSNINSSQILNISAVLNQYDFGFSKITVMNATTALWEFIKGEDGSVGDSLTLVRA